MSAFTDRIKNIFNLEAKVDKELRERIDVAVAQVMLGLDKASPALGDLLAGEEVQLEIRVALRLRAADK